MTLVRGREREREREKYNDGDDKSQVGLMIERKEEGKGRKEKMGNRNELMMVTGENIATHREGEIKGQNWMKDGKRNLREELGQFREGES